MVEKESGTAGVLVQPLGDVVDLAVQNDPAVVLLAVLKHLFPSVARQLLCQTAVR